MQHQSSGRLLGAHAVLCRAGSPKARLAGVGPDHPILSVADGRVVCVAPLAVGQELVAAEAAAGDTDGPAARELEATGMPPMAATVQG